MQEVWNDAWFGGPPWFSPAATVALGLWYGTGLRLFCALGDPAGGRAAHACRAAAPRHPGRPWTVAAFVLLMLTRRRGPRRPHPGTLARPWGGGRRGAERRPGQRSSGSSGCGWSTADVATWSPSRDRDRQRDERGHPRPGGTSRTSARRGRGRGLALARRHPGPGARGDRPEPCASRCCRPSTRPSPPGWSPCRAPSSGPFRWSLPWRGPVPAGRARRGGAGDDHHRDRRDPDGGAHAVRRGHARLTRVPARSAAHSGSPAGRCRSPRGKTELHLDEEQSALSSLVGDPVPGTDEARARRSPRPEHHVASRRWCTWPHRPRPPSARRGGRGTCSESRECESPR